MTTVLYIFLFIPFIILFAVFGATFMTAGYKKDLGRSLISLGASVAAIIISFVMSKLFAWAISMLIGGVLKKIIPEDSGMLSGMLEGTAIGIVKIVLALLLFGIFFAITMGIFKTVFVNHIRVDKLNFDTTGSRWGGLGVRFADALLVVLMLSLPLYGTLATVIPPVSSIMQMASTDQDDAGAVVPTAAASHDTLNISFMDTSAEVAPMPERTDSQDVVSVIKAIENHPVLIPYKYGPADWVYSGLSSFSMNGKSVDVARAAEVMGGLIDRFIAFAEVVGSEDEDVVISATEEIVSYARDNVIEERWFYNMSMALLTEFDKAMTNDALNFGAETEFITRLRPLFDMSYKEFKSNGVALLDFLEYLLSNETVVMFKSQQNDLTIEQQTEKMNEFLAKLGALINHSEQAVAAKQLIYITSFSSKFSMQNTDALFKNWGSGMLSDTEDQKRDAYLFFELTVDSESTFGVMQLVSMHPLFKSDGAMLLLQSEGVAQQLEWEFDGEASRTDIEALVKNDESFNTLIRQKLVSYEQAAIIDAALLLGNRDLFEYVRELIADRLGIDYSNYNNYNDFSHAVIGGADDPTLIVVRPKF